MNLGVNEIIKEPEPIPDLVKKPSSQKAKPKFDLSITTDETSAQQEVKPPVTAQPQHSKPLELTDNTTFEHLKTQASYIQTPSSKNSFKDFMS